MAPSSTLTVSPSGPLAKPLQSDQPPRVQEASKPRAKSYKPAELYINTPLTSAPSVESPQVERPPQPPTVSRPETIPSELKTQALHHSRQAERLRSNPYLGDPWPNKLSPGFPCHCLHVAAHSITDAAIRAATSYYAKIVATHAASNGTVPPLIDPWEHDLIRIRISKAQQQAIREIRAVTGLILHDNHNGRDRMHDQAAAVDYSGHVQPWMDALIHRKLMAAAVEAFKEIDERYSTKIYDESKQHWPFFFKLPGTIFSKPFMAKFPCLCKDAIANRVADVTLENAVKSVKSLSEESPASQQSIRKRLEMCIARATVIALEEIAEPKDKEHTCSSHGPAPHMGVPMTLKVYERCKKAAANCMQVIDWERAGIKVQTTNSDGRPEHQVQPSTQQKVMPTPNHQVVPDIQHQITPSTRLQAMCSPPAQPLPGVTHAGDATLNNNPYTLIERAIYRDLGKQVYADKVSLDAIHVTIVSLKDLIPTEDRESAVPQIRAKLQSSVTVARNYALDAIARYESIVDEAGSIDSARHLYLQEHGWMNAFLTHAIKNEAERAGKALRKKMEDAKICHGEATNRKNPISEREAAIIMTNFAEGAISRVQNFGTG